jgi:hypothetical protein
MMRSSTRGRVRIEATRPAGRRRFLSPSPRYVAVQESVRVHVIFIARGVGSEACSTRTNRTEDRCQRRVR